MAEPFRVAIDRLQPSQLYISEAKLLRLDARVGPAHVHRLHPVPVRRVGEMLMLTDGHTRTYAAWRDGQTEVDAVWEEDELDWEAYAECVAWCRAEGIRSVADLSDRVVSGVDYERLWLDRCRVLQERLRRERATVESPSRRPSHGIRECGKDPAANLP